MRAALGRDERQLKGRKVTKRILLPLLLVAALLALVAAGCGGGNDNGDSEARTADDKRMDAALEWAACMRKNGANVPDPQIDSNGMVRTGPDPDDANPPSQAVMAKASKACDQHLEEMVAGAGQKPSPEQQAQMEREALRFARCMRRHGVDMPDPRVGGEGGGMAVTLDPEQMSAPAFKRAEKACGTPLGRRAQS